MNEAPHDNGGSTVRDTTEGYIRWDYTIEKPRGKHPVNQNCQDPGDLTGKAPELFRSVEALACTTAAVHWASLHSQNKHSSLEHLVYLYWKPSNGC